MNLKNMKRSETTEQIHLISWAKSHETYIPELKLLHHIPNEGKRTNGSVLKAAGMKSGVPDLCLPVARMGYHGLYIEMKYQKGKATGEQEEFMSLLRQQGYKTAVAWGAEQAQEIIRRYLSRGPGFDLINCEEAPKEFGFCTGFPDKWTPCSTCEFYEGRKELKESLDRMQFTLAAIDASERMGKKYAKCFCGGTIHFIRSPRNKHLHARCDSCDNKVFQ